jgi:predicted TIM-barrel fold metal-dependent hydrolase
MRYFGIRRALVYDLKSYLQDSVLGNEELLKHIAGHKGLYSSWVLLPEHTREMDPLLQLLSKMEEYGVRAARMNPSLLGYSLEEWCVGKILSALEERGIPLFIDDDAESTGALQTWLQLSKVCEKHPLLKVVGSMSGHNRRLYSMMDSFENFYLSTSQFENHFGIEEVVGNFGAERIMFGTYHPYSPAAQVNQIVYADISSDDKQLIASGNLERILGLSSYEEITGAGEEIKDSSVILAAARKGLPLKGFVSIDSHAHVGPAGQFGYMRNASPEELIARMDRLGLTKAAISHFFGLLGDMSKGNSLVAEIVSRHPDRFIGFAVIDPNYPKDDVKKEIIRCFETLNLKGIKIHPGMHNVHLLNEKYEPVWDAAEKYEVPVLSHTCVEEVEGSKVSVENFSTLAPKYPKVTFIIGHVGECVAGLSACLEIAKKYGNVYLEISGRTTPRLGVIETMVKEIGAHRVLLGTDWAWWDLAWAMGSVFYARIPDEDKRKILGENMAKILDLDIKKGGNQERRQD